MHLAVSDQEIVEAAKVQALCHAIGRQQREQMPVKVLVEREHRRAAHNVHVREIELPAVLQVGFIGKDGQAIADLLQPRADRLAARQVAR